MVARWYLDEGGRETSMLKDRGTARVWRRNSMGKVGMEEGKKEQVGQDIEIL